MTQQEKDTAKLIRRAKTILGTFLVLIGGLLVYVSQTMNKEVTPTINLQNNEVTLQAHDVIVGIKDNNGNSLGQGVLVGTNGVLLTNQHIISGQEEDIVITYQGLDYLIDYVGLHAYDDFALIRIYDIETACVSTSTAHENGMNLFDILHTSSIFELASMTGSLTTNQTIQPGMSGTPLFSQEGTVHGLIQARDERADNVGVTTLITQSIQAWINQKAETTNCTSAELSTSNEAL